MFTNYNETRRHGGSIQENGCGTLNGITSKALRAIRDLGATHVWYTGIIRHATAMYNTPSIVKGLAGSPYAITDYYDVHPDLCEDKRHRMQEFTDLVDRSHKAGLDVIIDFVPNHVAREYHSTAKPRGVQDLGANDNPEWAFSPLNNFYYMPGQKFAPHVNIQDYQEYPARATGNDCFTASPSVNDWYETVKLNYGVYYQGGGERQFDPIPDTWNKMLHILLYWASKGVDGFRLDVISFISKTDGLPDSNPIIGALMGVKGVEHYFYGPRLHEFLHELNVNTFGKYDAFTVGECQGTGIEMSKLMTGDYRKELDVVFAFDHIENPGKSKFNKYKYDLRPMAKELVKWQLNYGNHCWPTVFFENHDTTRMTSKVCPDGHFRNELSKLLALMQMTFKGVPFVYQGQEIGMTNGGFKSPYDFKDVESLNYFKEQTDKGMTRQQAYENLLAGSRDNCRMPMCWRQTCSCPIRS